jgi:hypothetical protein
VFGQSAIVAPWYRESSFVTSSCVLLRPRQQPHSIAIAGQVDYIKKDYCQDPPEQHSRQLIIIIAFTIPPNKGCSPLRHCPKPPSTHAYTLFNPPNCSIGRRTCARPHVHAFGLGKQASVKVVVALTAGTFGSTEGPSPASQPHSSLCDSPSQF